MILLVCHLVCFHKREIEYFDETNLPNVTLAHTEMLQTNTFENSERFQRIL